MLVTAFALAMAVSAHAAAPTTESLCEIMTKRNRLIFKLGDPSQGPYQISEECVLTHSKAIERKRAFEAQTGKYCSTLRELQRAQARNAVVTFALEGNTHAAEKAAQVAYDRNCFNLIFHTDYDGYQIRQDIDARELFVRPELFF